jgi:hypothetical protein
MESGEEHHSTEQLFCDFFVLVLSLWDYPPKGHAEVNGRMPNNETAVEGREGKRRNNARGAPAHDSTEASVAVRRRSEKQQQ